MNGVDWKLRRDGVGFDRLAEEPLVAVAHSILVIAYHMIRHQQPYQDLGSTSFDERTKVHVVNRLTRRLEKLGYTVSVTPAAAV